MHDTPPHKRGEAQDIEEDMSATADNPMETEERILRPLGRLNRRRVATRPLFLLLALTDTAGARIPLPWGASKPRAF